MTDFYTYAYLRENGTPYYIGKGRGRRAFNPHGTISVPPKERILFLKLDLSEQESFKHEIYMIAVLGRKDEGTGILRNQTSGGDGSSGYVFTEAARRNVSIGKRGRSRKPFTKEHCERISKGKLGKNLKVTNENRSQRVSDSNRGRKWFVNPEGDTRFTREPPGPEWQQGRKFVHGK
jgi:hypothetical protein